MGPKREKPTMEGVPCSVGSCLVPTGILEEIPLHLGINIGLIEPKKLPNPVRESKTHQELHRELLFSHRRGLLPEHKPELQKVLETRRFKQLKQQQESQRPLTDLEEELRKRHQMLEQVCASQSFTNPTPAATGLELFPHNQQETATVFPLSRLPSCSLISL
uniref:Family with sequence similarity 107 member A n=1 Tax=Gopherus agassizii TaxID=38772 RepID=A0A452GUM9_9SAUR